MIDYAATSGSAAVDRVARRPRVVSRRRTRALAPWLLAGVAMFPVAVLSHEIGHWLPYRMLGYRGVTLHYGSVSDPSAHDFWELVRQGQLAAAAEIHPLWQPPAVAMGGLVVSYATALACYWYVTRRRANPFVVALGAIAVFRFIGGAPLILVRLLLPSARPSADETHAAFGMVIPELVLVAIGFVLLWLLWWRMPRALPPEGRRERLIALALGCIGGGALYIGLIGPRLLP
jgi:ribose/xylose/arabinose/galactoside ABC-type transport system permease subunit